MYPKVETEQRANGNQLIKVVYEDGTTYNLRANTDGTLEVNGGFNGGLLIKPYAGNDIKIIRDRS